MPDPVAPPVRPTRRELPEDFGDLVTQALRSGRLREVSEALVSKPAVAPAEARPATAELETPEVLPKPVPAAEALEDLLARVASLRGAGDFAAAEELVDLAPELLETLRAELREEAAVASRVVVELPPLRHTLALVADAFGAGIPLMAVSEAVRIDHVTLRLLSRGEHTQVLLRGDDPEDLAERARALLALGPRATLWSRSQVEAIEPPLVLLSRGPDEIWNACRVPLWLPDQPFDPGAPPPGEPLEALEVALVVPGDVVLKRYRASGEGARFGRKRESSARALGETRVGVIDLHGPGTFVRIVERVMRFDGLPGFAPQSTRRSLVGFTEHLGTLWPDAHVEGRRVCQSPEGAPSVRAGDGLVVSGWSWWEEHTRLCRLHRLGEP